MKADQLAGVFRALADPTRRQILDALCREPRTTGQLCRPFRLSRFAIMKHLGILQQAGLVVVRRVGRERRNHLNAVPIQQVYERWVRPYEAHWARNLLRLKTHAESNTGDNSMATNPFTQATFGVAQVDSRSRSRRSPPASGRRSSRRRVAGGSRISTRVPQTKGFVIEPRLGGHAYEDCGGGAGQIWYIVVGIQPPHSIMLLGLLTPAFGGPAQTILQLTLEGDR